MLRVSMVPASYQDLQYWYLTVRNELDDSTQLSLQAQILMGQMGPVTVTD